MIFLIGGSGLIGSAFKRHLNNNFIKFQSITRQNKKKFYGKKCDLLIDCNGNGSKRAGIENPFFDFNASVLTVVENLTKINYKKYIYISTMQVYEGLKNKNLSKEDFSIRYNKINNYGFNKLVAELYVKKYAKRYLIFRLPYVVGPGLSRNPFHDIRFKKKTYLSLDSKINCLHTDTVATLTMRLNKKNNETYNLGSNDTIKVSQILKILNLKNKDLKKTIKTKDINNVNLEKVKKIIKLPKAYLESKKYLFGKK
jgi:nucleoside-diphosphate-sugar epimerase